MVAVLEVVGTHTGGLFDVIRSADSFRIHGHERRHAVTAVHVEQLAGGTHAMCSVNIAAVLMIVVQTPVVPVVGPEILQVVDVAALDVEHLAEQPLLGHIQRIHLEEVVDAVFELHAVLARALRGVDEGPDLVERHGRRHFDGGVLALFHGVYAHPGVVLPVGSDIHQVDIVALAELLPSIFRIGVLGSGGETGLFEHLLALGHVFRQQVAQSDDFRTGNVDKTLHGSRSAHAETDEANAYGVYSRSGIGYHVGLSGGTFGNGGLNNSGLATVVAASGEEQCRQNCDAENFFHDHSLGYLVIIQSVKIREICKCDTAVLTAKNKPRKGRAYYLFTSR